MSTYGMTSLLQMVVAIGMIIFCWRIFRNVKFEMIFSIPSPIEARILRLFLAIIIGNGVTQFIFDYMSWTSALQFISNQ
jgi:uncharacterized membrane protein YwzB